MRRWRSRWAVAVAAGLALCAGLVLVRHRPPTELSSAGQAAAQESVTSESAEMPPALRMAWIAQVQKDAPPAYALTPFGATGYHAAHSERTMTATFSEYGAMVGDGDEHVGLRLARYGYAGNMHEATAARPRALKNRVEYRRGPELSEWYVHGPLGIEHGFTVTAPPAGRRSGELVFEMAVRCGTPVLSEDGSVLLASTSGGASVHYRDLYATDATGSLLAARLAVDGPRLSIHVQDAEARYPIVVDPLIWFEQQNIPSPSSALTPNNNFGYSVAVSGDTAVIGAVTDAAAAPPGEAYVFVRSGTSWSQQQKLTASDAAGGDGFGSSVAISGDTAIIGAAGSNLTISESGSAYVFVRSGTIWSEQQKLTESPLVSQDGFGHSVAISGDTAVIGARFDSGAGNFAGTTYVFVRSDTNWSQQQRLTSSDIAANDEFGISVAVSGDTALIGAFQDDDAGSSSGSAYVFVRSGTIWSEQQKLTASDATDFDQYGFSVALSGDTAVIGAKPGSAGQSGSAYAFVRSGTTWSEQQKLAASDAQADDGFGYSVAISGDTAVIGTFPILGTDSAYVFVRSGSSWTEQQEFTDSQGSGFGKSVAVSGDTVVIGAPNDSAGANSSGSAHFFILTPDDDDDLVADIVDNCPLNQNPTQDDLDEDGAGDVCDDDDDGDGIIDTTDNCPRQANADQLNTDGDTAGNDCDADDDGDGISDAVDNCPLITNASQLDTDSNNIGDACDDADADGDTIPNDVDNCPLVASPDQTDSDGDGDGDLCDDDDDDDGIVDADDNCRLSSNNDQEDADHNGIGDVCETGGVVQTFYGCGVASRGAPATGMFWLLLALLLSRRRRQA